MTKSTLLGAFVILAVTAYGQDEDVAQHKDTLYIQSSAIKVAYLGSIVYPGFKIGTELPMKIKYLIKDKKNGSKTIIKSKALTFNLAYYHQKDFHDNLFLTSEWQIRRQRSKGWFYEFSPGLGVSRTFVNGTTYEVSDDGDVSEKKWEGYTYALASVAGGLGYDFYHKTKHPVKAYTKLSVIALFPYNSSIYARPNIELGIIYSLKSFLKTNPTFKTKHK